MKSLSNQEIARIILEMAELYGMRDEPFKMRAYEHVAGSIDSFTEPVTDLYAREGREGLKKISGVGDGIAGHLEQLLTTGSIRRYEQLKKLIPVDIFGLVAVEGVGPKTVRALWEKLGVRTLDDLERAARTHRIRKLYRFGSRSEANILRSIEELKRARREWLPR